MDLSFLLPIVLVVCSVTLIILGFFWKNFAKFLKTDLRAIPALIEERFLTFRDQIMSSVQGVAATIEQPTFEFESVLASPEVEKTLSNIVMNSIMTLSQDEEVRKYFTTLIGSLAQGANPMGLPPQTEEEAQVTETKVKEFTKDMAMGLINEAMPIGLGGFLDKKQEGWRDWLGEDPHAMIRVAGFLNEIGAKEKVEGVISDLLKNITGSSSGSSSSSPTSRTDNIGVVG